MYRYQIKNGHENAIFAYPARNLGGGIVESDEPLTNSLLSLIDEPPEEPVDNASVAAPEAPTEPAQPEVPQPAEEPIKTEATPSE